MSAIHEATKKATFIELSPSTPALTHLNYKAEKYIESAVFLNYFSQNFPEMRVSIQNIINEVISSYPKQIRSKIEHQFKELPNRFLIEGSPAKARNEVKQFRTKFLISQKLFRKYANN